MPVIFRIDGRAFHTVVPRLRTARLKSNKNAFEQDLPFDNFIADCIAKTALTLCEEIQGAKCAYVQSDEISILVVDYSKLQSEAWFDYNVQKMTSVSASVATWAFIQVASLEFPRSDGILRQMAHTMINFDSRVFNLPREEVNNYFVWRQQDWVKNSVQMLARAHYPQKQLIGKKQADMHEMLHQVDVNWADLDDRWKNGIFITNFLIDGWAIKPACPIFSKIPELINQLLEPTEE